MAGDSDDLLNPEEIEKLLNSAGQGDASDSSGQSSADASGAAAGGNDDLLDPSEIESLLKQQDSGGAPAPNPVAQQTEALLNQAEADLAAAISPNLTAGSQIPAELGSPAPFHFNEFGGGSANQLDDFGLSSLQDVELDLRIELGRTELLIEEVLELKEGSVVPLDKLAGDPVDILVNGRLVARGEVLVLNDNFCVRVAEILTPNY